AIRRGDASVLPLTEIPLPGLHNALNVCAALAAIEAASDIVQARALATHVRTFRALPHRLQTLGELGGVRYINDSISTTPYATIEALRSIADAPTTVLVGGFDRGVEWTAFVDHVRDHPPHAVIAMGANGPAIAQALRRIEPLRCVLVEATTLDAALAQARAATQAGGTILLSPGAPSFDQFRDYAERGRTFARLAGFDPDRIAHIAGLGIA
ncbi:MAG TPA: UDP-N-acetylmuramoyl-L-alanine--D-glutamate ligase, partial [Rudaea sp.]